MANVMDGDWADAGFIIRGVSSEGLVPGSAPLATLYIDGVQQTVRGARRGARGLFDVEQVEVYRGPQSTLSGRAAMAGAIYIKTKDPTFERKRNFLPRSPPAISTAPASCSIRRWWTIRSPFACLARFSVARTISITPPSSVMRTITSSRTTFITRSGAGSV